jgi:hypothetical protein
MIAAITALIIGAAFGFGRITDDTFEKATACIENQGVGEPWPNCSE